MNIDNKMFNDKELEKVDGGVMPILFADQSKVSNVNPVPLKPEYEKKSEKDTLVPIPY